VWDIPNVKANHIEKTKHPCQFPIAIPQRLIKALTPINGIVLDPFMGSGTSGVASILEQRCFVGAEIQKEYNIKRNQKIDITENQIDPSFIVDKTKGAVALSDVMARKKVIRVLLILL